MEEKERQMLTLTLPLIELEEGKKPWLIETYDDIESGTYFVKDSEGMFHFVEVVKGDSVCSQFILPARICNLFTREMVVDGLSMDMEQICRMQEEMHRMLAQLVADSREMREGKNEAMRQSAGRGFISEETLAKIIKDVRR